jgi:two-component system, chemotaxis family, CheB/CheR fusion protein
LKTEPKDTAKPEDTAASGTATEPPSFPIVAIGASAGGLEAMRQLLANLPDDTGMAFVVIQHLDPDRPSMLASMLGSDARMPVVEVSDGLRTEPNHVYVIPPGADLSIEGGVLALVPRPQGRKLHLPIDAFCRSLARDVSQRAIGVVLSGSASDGTAGLTAIKSAGGITFAQEPRTAQFPSMPESAMDAGVVDFHLPPEKIASELVRLSRHPYLTSEQAPEQAPEAGAGAGPTEEADTIASILKAVREHTQVDFRGYKRTTLMRRIDRRIALRRLGSFREYADALRDDRAECQALAEDILIHVTSFFRDPAAFEALEQQVLPAIFETKDPDADVRVWVPGCSSGEEVYSIAISLLEFMRERHLGVPIKIFGSDLSERAIQSARAGLYSEQDMEGVSPKRRERFFERAEGRYQIGKQVRDLCVFVRHDLTKDPPFAKLDLISCRNVLIYFDEELQHRVLPLLHHCLNSPGYLFLGSSEGIRDYGELFAPVDKQQRIFVKQGESPRLHYPLALGHEAESRLPLFEPAARPVPAREAQRLADHLLLSRYAPAGVVVDERLEVVQFRGHTGDYLEPPSGQPQMNVIKLARSGLVGQLREAIEMAKAESVSVRKRGVQLVVGSQARNIDLEVIPLAGAAGRAERYFLILFEEPGAPGAARGPSPTLTQASTGSAEDELARLTAELAATRDYLQAIGGEHEDTTDELGAANSERFIAAGRGASLATAS